MAAIQRKAATLKGEQGSAENSIPPKGKNNG
jgi:hypothetical protein